MEHHFMSTALFSRTHTRKRKIESDVALCMIEESARMCRVHYRISSLPATCLPTWEEPNFANSDITCMQLLAKNCPVLANNMSFLCNTKETALLAI
jgi:hypothetical protein